MNRMSRTILVVLGAGMLLAGFALAQQDVKGSSDHPLLSRMPNFYITKYEVKEFDQLNFKDEKGKPTAVEGKKYHIVYMVKEGSQVPSILQILRNFQNAIEKIGGKKIYEDSINIYLKLEKDDLITWVHVLGFGGGKAYDLDILEEGRMKQDVVADAASMARDIASSGKVALYGIYFDTAKTDIKPESEPAIKEIANLLQQNPALKLFVVGHTDNVGTLDANMDLSKRRAESVISYLAANYKADAGRLKGYGVGPLAPVASNKTDEGKAKNRRVELVEQ
ncbi:MAG: yiaD 1 [Candidatus Aminicenantes bacterium]|nr:yiaD 1 [Candidatus Aminicenantes bacterium]